MKRLDQKKMDKSIKQLVEMNKKGVLCFDNVVQRKYCWNNTEKDNRQSKLIDSMLRGYPVSALYCASIKNEDGKNIYSFLDGKQRMTTVLRFVNNEFKLVGLDTFELEDGTEININGLTYDELPDEMKDDFRTYQFTIHYFDEVDDDIIFEIFARLNNGKALSAIEKSRSECPSFYKVKELGQEEVFSKMLTQSAIESYGNEDIVVKSWIMLYKSNPCLDTKEVKPIMSNLNISDDEFDTLKKVFNYIMRVHDIIDSSEEIDEKLKKKIAKRIYTKTHFISVVPFIQMAIEEELSITDVSKWLSQFYGSKKTTSIEKLYNDCCQSGSGHADAVKKRNTALLNSFNSFFDTIDIKENNKEKEGEVEIENNGTSFTDDIINDMENEEINDIFDEFMSDDVIETEDDEEEKNTYLADMKEHMLNS